MTLYLPSSHATCSSIFLFHSVPFCYFFNGGHHSQSCFCDPLIACGSPSEQHGSGTFFWEHWELNRVLCPGLGRTPSFLTLSSCKNAFSFPNNWIRMQFGELSPSMSWGLPESKSGPFYIRSSFGREQGEAASLPAVTLAHASARRQSSSGSSQPQRFVQLLFPLKKDLIWISEDSTAAIHFPQDTWMGRYCNMTAVKYNSVDAWRVSWNTPGSVPVVPVRAQTRPFPSWPVPAAPEAGGSGNSFPSVTLHQSYISELSEYHSKWQSLAFYLGAPKSFYSILCKSEHE